MRGRLRKNKEPKATTNQINIEKEPLFKTVRTAITVEGITTFCNELDKALKCIYFGETCNENDDIEICNINFVI